MGKTLPINTNNMKKLIIVMALAMITASVNADDYSSAKAQAEADVIPLPRPLQKAKPEKAHVKQADSRRLTAVSISSAKALATYAPRPRYPIELASRHITGSGVYVVMVNHSGVVTSCTVAGSTGSNILDRCAVMAFLQWRFQSGSVSKVKIPVAFTVTGARY
jgi:TonB family protein